jgi:ribosome recycling factor
MRECEKRIKTAPPLEEFDELAGGLGRIQEAGKRIKRLRTLLREMNDATASMKQHNDEAKKVQRELDKLTDGKCPICGKPNK